MEFPLGMNAPKILGDSSTPSHKRLFPLGILMRPQVYAHTLTSQMGTTA